jgi:hypothetical protein
MKERAAKVRDKSFNKKRFDRVSAHALRFQNLQSRNPCFFAGEGPPIPAMLLRMIPEILGTIGIPRSAQDSETDDPMSR